MYSKLQNVSVWSEKNLQDILQGAATFSEGVILNLTDLPKL
jgi:hypothetical protein